MKRDDFLKHVAWTGTGIAWSLSGTGLFSAGALAADGGISFVQISDSHIGFSHPENPDVIGTLQQTIGAINAMPVQPSFVVHTGDVTHLAKPAQFDTAKQLLGTLKAPLIVLPGEHDVIGTSDAFFAAFRRSDAPQGWFSWDQGGVHFLSLVNVFNFEIDGKLGAEQLDFVEKDLAAQKKERVHLEVTKAQGGLDSESSAAIEAARPHLEHCHPGSGGKVAVQVTKQARATYMSIVPGESLDPTQGHCVLEALSTVDLPETAGNVGGPAVKPSGFTSLITVSW